MTVPDEAVEAAARIYNHASTGADDWDDDDRWSPEDREVRLGEMRAALEAAAPFIASQAFDYGWREGRGQPTPINTETGDLLHDQAQLAPWNPYRSGT
jgi:hypothetical protein